jgi:hypothetical protein
MRNTIIKILMERDGLTREEALASYREGIAAFMEYLEAGDLTAAMDICEEFWGLEPDYLDDIMFAI